MAEEIANVAEEIQQEAPVQPQEELAPEGHSPEVEAKDEKVSYSKDENLVRQRQSLDRLELENKELRQDKERRDYYERQPHTPAPQKEEEDLGIADDDIVEGKVVNQLHKELKELKEFVKSYKQEKVEAIPSRLTAKFEDFEQVVTQENLDKLKKSEPELYSSITTGKDLYNAGVSAYKTLKATGIVKEDNFKSHKEQVHANHGKPVSAQAIRGQGALSDANIFSKGLTPELKKQLQKEMAESAKAH